VVLFSGVLDPATSPIDTLKNVVAPLIQSKEMKRTVLDENIQLLKITGDLK
jgi:hypothetical protein